MKLLLLFIFLCLVPFFYYHPVIIFTKKKILRGGAEVARKVHTLEDGGSIPLPATNPENWKTPLIIDSQHIY